MKKQGYRLVGRRRCDPRDEVTWIITITRLADALACAARSELVAAQNDAEHRDSDSEEEWARAWSARIEAQDALLNHLRGDDDD